MKKFDPLAALTPKKRHYVENRVQGKSKKAAALEAGYSLTMANNAGTKIETPEVQEAFSELIRKRIPAEKIIQRIEEGLDAEETKFFQFQGVVMDSKNVVSWSERRAYAELAAEYGLYHQPKLDLEHSGGVTLLQSVPRPERKP